MKPIRAMVLLALALGGCQNDLEITTSDLPRAHPGKDYRVTFKTTGGSGAKSWSIESGSIPAGMSLGSFSGDLSGIPVAEGVHTFTVKVTDEAVPANITTKTFTVKVQFSVDTEVVNGSDGTAIQAACDALKNTGGVVWLPAGNYLVYSKITVYADTTICGAGILENVRGSGGAPKWEGRSRCYAVDPDLRLFETKGDRVTFAHMMVEGASTDPKNKTRKGNGIHATGTEEFRMVNCEVTGNVMGLVLRESKKAIVEKSYFHHNLRWGLGYGICVIGKTMAQGGSRVVIRDCEFATNRHDIASNSPKTWWAAIRCTFRDNDPVTNQAAVDTHPHGYDTLRYYLADCTFENTRPTSFRAGTGSILRNRFKSSCGWWYSSMIKVGIPEHNGTFVDCTFHDSYIADNTNQSGKKLFASRSYNYSDKWWKPKRRVPVFSTFLGGSKWSSFLWSPIRTNSRPVVGEIYLSKTGSSKRTHHVLKGKKYDVHAMVLDPQGRKNLKSLTVYLAPMKHWDGSFDPNEAYSAKVEIQGKKVGPGWDSRTGKWHANVSNLSIKTKGNDRYHVKFRVKIPADVDISGPYRLVAFARDKNQHVSLNHWDPYEITIR